MTMPKALQVHGLGKDALVVSDASALAAILSTRLENGSQSFWLAQSHADYPCLHIAFRDDLATLTYFPEEHHPGYRSVGDLVDDEAVEFFIVSATESDEIPGEFVISSEQAIAAAQEFQRTETIPGMLEWFEL